MRRLGIRIANIALFTLCCFLLAEVANKISVELLLPRSTGPLPAVAVLEIPAPGWGERQPILQRNLFGAQVVSDPIVEAQPEPEEIEKTELPLELLGTIASDNEALARATIWDKGEREHQVLRIGDPLTHHTEVRLERVERRRVILANGEQREELSLDDRVSTLQAAPAVKQERSSRRKRHPRRVSRRASRQSRPEADEQTAAELEAIGEELNRGQMDSEDLVERLKQLGNR